MSRLLASTIFVFSISAALCAQVQTDSILIKVTDQQGAILPGVSVTHNGVTIARSPNLRINANGLITGTSNSDRPILFKLTGSYIMPWRELVVSGNLRSESGPPVTRQISRSPALGESETINLEPMGNSGFLRKRRRPNCCVLEIELLTET
jgi:hypothetical protein